MPPGYDSFSCYPFGQPGDDGGIERENLTNPGAPSSYDFNAGTVNSFPVAPDAVGEAG